MRRSDLTNPQCNLLLAQRLLRGVEVDIDEALPAGLLIGQRRHLFQLAGQGLAICGGKRQFEFNLLRVRYGLFFHLERLVAFRTVPEVCAGSMGQYPTEEVRRLGGYYWFKGVVVVHKHLENLERLKAKYQSRYGGDDDLVVTLQETLEERRKAVPKPLLWGAPRPRVARQNASRLGRLAGLVQPQSRG